MSFRGRLLLFFTIIVVIPMIAVALVLFSLTADSETGKSDAEIAQGVRAAFGVYDGDRARARKPLQAIAGDAKLGAALAHPDRLRPIQSRLAALARLHKNVRQIVAYDLNRTKLASVGSPTAVAAAVATPSTGKGRPLGYVSVSVTGANDYAREVGRLTQGDFSEPVPVEGADEFAALGTEFNAMSGQLASKIDEVQRKRGELEETIRRVGDAFAAGLDREGIINLTLRTAVEACEADAGRALPIDARRMRSARVGDSTPELEVALERAERAAFAVDADRGPSWLASLEGSDDERTEQHRPERAEVEGFHSLAAPLLARLGSGSSIEQIGVISIARPSRQFDEQ